MKSLNISGEFYCTLDPNDNGESFGFQNGNWDEENLICLPGTLNSNKMGTPINEEDFTEINGKSLDMPRPAYEYIGKAWYKKNVFISKEDLQNKEAVLYLERIIFQSKVWINGEYVGENSSLSTAHQLSVTKHLKADQDNLIVIAIDNRDVLKIGDASHSYTNHTQTKWNGIVGRIEIHFFNKVFVEDVQIFTSITDIDVKLNVANKFDDKKNVKIDLKIIDDERTIYCTSKQVDVQSRHHEEFKIYLWNNAKLWDEFNPNLYKLEVKLTCESCEGCEEIVERKFGIRTITTEGRHILINENRVHFRGNLDCCIFPLTGYPETSFEFWVENMKLLKSYGLNHVRFHSWCPPEEAFHAADVVGMYIQAEGPMWMDWWLGTTVGCCEEHFEFLPKEHTEINRQYGNHPSFVVFSNGNELNGDFRLLEKMVIDLKKCDNRRLYTLTSNFDRRRRDTEDIFIASTIDEVVARAEMYMDRVCEATSMTYDKAVNSCEIPFLCHEVGQYAVYPDLNGIEKYTGCINPVNLKAIKIDLEKKNLIKYADEFVKASGHLSKILYKAEIETLLNTEQMAGIQLLSLQDFTGQSTATIGMLDVFWDNKGMTTSEEFASFCGEIVPLFQTHDIIYNSNEELQGVINVYNYSNQDYLDSTVVFKMLIDNQVFKEIEINNIDIKRPGLNRISNVSCMLSEIEKASKVKVEVTIKGTEIKNSWDIWVYPTIENPEEANNFEVRSALSENDLKELEAGKNILFVPGKDAVKSYKEGNFTTVFWSPIVFLSEKNCGMICDSGHEVFNSFPTDKYSDFQWKKIMESSISMAIDELDASFEPIVQLVPNFYHNEKLANMFEAKLGKGKLFVCSIDIFTFLHKDMPKQYLKKSIYKYLNSSRFNPKQSLSSDDLRRVFNT